VCGGGGWDAGGLYSELKAGSKILPLKTKSASMLDSSKLKGTRWGAYDCYGEGNGP